MSPFFFQEFLLLRERKNRVSEPAKRFQRRRRAIQNQKKRGMDVNPSSIESPYIVTVEVLMNDKHR